MNPANIHILIVEDDEVMQIVVQKKLEAEGYKTTVVSNGLRAIEALRNREFQLVLMDINMPEQDGLDSIRWIRDSDDAYLKSVPVFALTTYNSSEHTEEILEAGMNGHLIKPFDIKKFNQLWQSHFGV